MSERWGGFFTVKELQCKGTDECEMDEGFMDRLVSVRKAFNKPMIITSGYRHQAHNSAIGGARYSPHLYGKAVDVAVDRTDAYELVRVAMNHGMTGIGVKQRNGSRFIHLDDMSPSENHIRPTMWSYK
jgi:zinc D-Ala-D-Ala carboxypeptidase